MPTDQPLRSLLPPDRIASIDVFRGLTMLLMLFVNDIGDRDLGHIQNAPWWLHHMPGAVDGMTMPDVIWPCFMFIVGLAIPLALERRIARGDSLAKLSGHVVTRALALIFIGLCMVNGCYMAPMNEAAMGMSGAWWRVLMFLGIILVWNRYPDARGKKKWLFVALRMSGAAILIYLLAIYRADLNGQVVWLRSRWWGVIGLIGWGYLVAALIWLLCRDHGAALMGAMALLVAIAASVQHGEPSWWRNNIEGYLPSLHALAGFSSMAVAGMVVATLFRPNSTATTPNGRIAWILAFAAGFAAVGFFLRPLWGIHKSGCSPSWILYSMAIACAIYAFLYWLVDLKKITAWTALVGPAGANTLLMYTLPYIFYSLLAVMGIDFLQTHIHEGWIGVARSAVLAMCFVGVTGVLTRCHIRLHV